jgi:hypothetical protein
MIVIPSRTTRQIPRESAEDRHQAWQWIGKPFAHGRLGRSFVDRPPGNPIDMEQQKTPPPTPRDATKATAEQRELQEQLDDRLRDPQAPARHQDRHQIADET